MCNMADSMKETSVENVYVNTSVQYVGVIPKSTGIESGSPCKIPTEEKGTTFPPTDEKKRRGICSPVSVTMTTTTCLKITCLVLLVTVIITVISFSIFVSKRDDGIDLLAAKIEELETNRTRDLDRIQDQFLKFRTTEGAEELQNAKISQLLSDRLSDSAKISQLESAISADHDIIQKYNSRITILENSLNTRQVAFNAWGATNTSAEANQTIVFQHLLQNLGSAYSNATGIFTAPVNGIYLFRVQLCTNLFSDGTFKFVVNKNIISVFGRRRSHAELASTSGSVVFYLSLGQTVRIKTVYSTVLYESRNDCWNQFTGVLIHA